MLYGFLPSIFFFSFPDFSIYNFIDIPTIFWFWSPAFSSLSMSFIIAAIIHSSLGAYLPVVSLSFASTTVYVYSFPFYSQYSRLCSTLNFLRLSSFNFLTCYFHYLSLTFFNCLVMIGFRGLWSKPTSAQGNVSTDVTAFLYPWTKPFRFLIILWSVCLGKLMSTCASMEV